MTMPEPDLEAQLDELERHLETVVAHLEAEEFDEARKHTLDISTLLNCGMCKGIENGVLGGVMFAAGMTPATSQRRVDMVTDEIESFIDTELVAARQLARNMEEGVDAA